MLRGFVVVFVLLFLGAHLAGGQSGAFSRPLSCFRDVEPAWIGYAMFVVLVATACEMAHTARRVGDRNQFIVYSVVACSLALTAITPSGAGLHHLGVLVTLFTLFVNYAWQLDQRDMPYWLTLHLSIPLLLLTAIFLMLGPSGHWQKALDLYFMVAVVIHHQDMVQSRSSASSTQPAIGTESNPSLGLTTTQRSNA
ncbi:MAG: hypothetical protein AB7G28_18965 [Pirellulales bacterium]